MKIADYGKAITSYIESPTTEQKKKVKLRASLMDEYLGDQLDYQKAVDEGFQGTEEEYRRYKSTSEEDRTFLAEGTPFDFSGLSVPQLKLLYKRYTGTDGPSDPKQLISELKRLIKGLDEDGIPFATGGRVHLAEGSEDIVEPSKSMQVDTTTKGFDLFTIDDFKEKAEIYVGAYHNNALPTADIKSALNKFTQKGIDDGTFSADDAIKVVQDLKFQFQDRAQKQRLRDNIIAGTGTVEREEQADGGRMGFADNPLKNFNITTDLPFDLNKPLGKTYEVGDKSILKNLQSFDNINPNLRKNYISETELSRILDAPGSTFQDQKYKNVGAYNKLLNVLGEPVVGEKIPGTVKNELYYDKTNLTKDAIKFIKDPKSRIDYTQKGKNIKGALVVNDENLKQFYIEKYNEGYGPKHIMKLIDPNNTLGVNQSKYGSAVAETLIANNDIIKRDGISKAQAEYHNQKVKNTDLIIEKIGKIYDKNPSGSLERIAHVIAGGKKNFDGASPRQQTEFMTKAGLRSYDLLQYLKGARPSVDENTNLKIKNKDTILNVLENSKHPIYGMIREGDVRNFKFAEQDAFFGDKRNTHHYIRRDINNLVNLQAKNVKAKNRFVIDEGPGLTTALKNGLPVLTRFSNLLNKKTNQAKIELDVKLINAYPVVTNLDTGKTKYTITEIDVEKSKTHGYGLTEKDIGKVIDKKDHPAIKAYNKFSRSFSKANNVKTPIFEFGNIEDKIDLKDRKKITDEAAKELKKMNKTYGFYMSNMGTDLKLIEERLKEKPLKKSDFKKKAIVFRKMRDSLQDIYNSIPLKGLRVGPSTAAAVLDYNFFTNVMGVPSAEAALGAATWFTKNPETARRIGDSIIAVTSGTQTVDEFIKANGNLLTEIAKASVESIPVSKDDDVMSERLKEMDQAMAVPLKTKKAEGGSVYGKYAEQIAKLP